jgi:hypothetical protein
MSMPPAQLIKTSAQIATRIARGASDNDGISVGGVSKD